MNCYVRMSIYTTNAIEALNRLLRKTLKDPPKIPGALSDDGAASSSSPSRSEVNQIFHRHKKAGSRGGAEP